MSIEFVKRKNTPEMPKILYKYRTWKKDNHKRLLTHNEIYYASPSEFGEITECNLERDYDSISDQDIRDFCMNDAMRQVDSGMIHVSSVLSKARELYDGNMFYDLDNRENTRIEFDIHMNKVLSVFSTSETPTNERLWDDFGDFGKGYCVGIDFTEIYKDVSIFGTAGRVDYYDEDNPPKVAPFCLSNDKRTQKMMKIMYSLPEKFKEEAEFRLTKMHIKNRVVSINPAWVQEVILGSEIDSVTQGEIIKIVKEKYPNAKLKRIFVEPTFGVMTVIDLEKGA